MEELRAVISAAVSYLKQNPDELVRLVKNAALLRVGVPFVALNWLVSRGKNRKTAKDVVLEAMPPGVRITATLDLMGTPVRGSAIVYVEQISINAQELRFEIRLAEVLLKVLDERADTPIAALLKSGALDLSKPGNLAAYMPKRPAMLVEARDDRVVLDLMRLPRFLGSRSAQKAVEMIAPIVTVRAVEADSNHLDVALHAFPDGVRHAFRPLPGRVREALLALKRALVNG